jgi:hypothetical protein
MQQIVASIGENDSLTFLPPALALLDKLGVIVEPAQDLKHSVTTLVGQVPDHTCPN